MSMEFLRIFCRSLCKLTFFVIQIQELSTKARFSALKASCLLTQRFNYEILQVPCLDFKVNVLNDNNNISSIAISSIYTAR